MNKNFKYIIFIIVFFQAVVVSVIFAQGDNPVLNNDTTSASYEENLRRWENMSEEQREAIRQKVHAVDPQQKEAIRKNAEKFKQLPKKEQNRIKDNFQKFKELPDEKKELLRERNRRFQGLSPEERAQLRRGVREKREHKEDIRDRREDGVDRRVDQRGRREDIGGRGPGSDLKSARGIDNAPLRQRGGPGINRQNHLGPQGGRGPGNRGKRGGSLRK